MGTPPPHSFIPRSLAPAPITFQTFGKPTPNIEWCSISTGGRSHKEGKMLNRGYCYTGGRIRRGDTDGCGPWTGPAAASGFPARDRPRESGAWRMRDPQPRDDTQRPRGGLSGPHRHRWGRRIPPHSTVVDRGLLRRPAPPPAHHDRTLHREGAGRSGRIVRIIRPVTAPCAGRGCETRPSPNSWGVGAARGVIVRSDPLSGLRRRSGRIRGRRIGCNERTRLPEGYGPGGFRRRRPRNSPDPHPPRRS